MPFPNIFSREDIESLNFTHQLGIFLHTAFVFEILLVRTISASSTNG